ncbi:T9SS type A sorting domain-containing protein [Hymenobacter sp. BT523]|uniref:T9SS type A sorting domain-containing protein n=1 Tax=Hymenobacter sp. BT523 TaxID=2795725 RepID=UPI0018EA36F3|nr:T9SS type A sorting domain-containing protein [Hymenobacter sp. BT523]MBJ6109129.1 T9SS type A sorting domain-containing protein [Hymenobacter sp. BT523]
MRKHFLSSRAAKRAGSALLLLILGRAAQAQTPVTVTIGAGTSASATNVLLSTSTTTNKYARTISIFSAAELTAAGAVPGNIVSIAWFKGGTGELTSADSQLSVYMKSTSATNLGGDPVTWATEVATATPVYTNLTLSMPTGTGFKTFALSTPFAWNGTSNVEVLVDWFRNGTPTADISWQYTAVTAASGVHATQVNSVVIPTVRYAANRPNTQFVISRTGLASRENREAALVSLYPNPARQLLNVLVPAELTHQSVATTLINALGQVAHRQVLPAGPAGAQGQLDISQLAAGVYTLQLATGTAFISKRVIVE